MGNEICGVVKYSYTPKKSTSKKPYKKKENIDYGVKVKKQ